MPRRKSVGAPPASEPLPESALESMQKRMVDFESVWKNDTCASRGFTDCSGRCAFVYSAWTCVPNHLYKEAKSDSLRMIMYIVMHSPRMGKALERLAASLDSIAARETKDALHKYTKSMFGEKVWSQFLKGNTDAMSTAIVRKAKGSIRRALQMAVFVAAASVIVVGMGALIVPTVAVVLGWLVLQLSSLLNVVTRYFSAGFYATLFASAPWVATLIASFVGVVALLEMFSPNTPTPFREQREDIGSWFDKFSVALSRAERDDVAAIKPHDDALNFGKRGMQWLWEVVSGPLSSTVGTLWRTVKKPEEEEEEEYVEEDDDDYLPPIMEEDDEDDDDDD